MVYLVLIVGAVALIASLICFFLAVTGGEGSIVFAVYLQICFVVFVVCAGLLAADYLIKIMIR